MDVKTYTNANYIAITDLKTFGTNFVVKISDYRSKFTEFIHIGDEFVKIVETPELVKKRYSKNVDIKEEIDFISYDNDFILEMAKKIIKNRKYKEVDKELIKKIIIKFKSNDNDLTIVTEWITNNINLFIKKNALINLRTFPKINDNDLQFINRFNNMFEYYSIADYKTLNKTSYETARTALSKLHELGFYTRIKIGKKFTYKPTLKIKKLLEGGKNEY